jgi:hypothetical protein
VNHLNQRKSPSAPLVSYDSVVDTFSSFLKHRVPLKEFGTVNGA